MQYKLTNISGGQIVCDLANGETLRLNNKESQNVKESEITPHIRNLEILGLMMCREISVTKTRKKKEE